MNRDIFVWLLAVRLLARDVWLADSGAISEERREALWSQPLVQAYWEGERARWLEEEALQTATAPSHHGWSSSITAPRATWYRDPTDDQETARLAGLDLPPPTRFRLESDRLVALGPRRPDDVFLRRPPTPRRR